MSSFKEFALAVNRRLKELDGNRRFYLVDCPNAFEIYLASFPPGTNNVFRERTEHDCNCCKQFIRNLGLMVAVQDGKVLTLWEQLGDLPPPYDTVAAAMHKAVSSSSIKSVFKTTELSFGKQQTFEESNGEVITWSHFYGNTPAKARKDDPSREIGDAAATYTVFKRGLDELRLSDIDDVIDMISSNCLYRGEEHRPALLQFRKLKVAYDSCESRELFIWENLGESCARIRNTVIGTLLVDLAEGKSLEAARASFEKKVDPQNYRRPTALVTGRMVELAVAKLNELGLENSVNRRFANLSDISVNDIVFVDNSVVDQTKDGLAQLLMAETTYSFSDRHGVEIGVEEFLAMGKKKIELVVESQHLPNFVSLTAPVQADSPSLFRWNNSFAWSYDGDTADSIKEKVKAAGGNVNAKMRCSLAWFGHSDLDIHCTEPSGTHIYFRNKANILDVDANYSRIVDEPVENLSWNTVSNGEYKISVHNFTRRSKESRPGFELEVEFNGSISHFSFPRTLGDGERLDNALTLKVENGVLTKITPDKALSNFANRAFTPEKWGIKTSRPVKVNMIMLSPNHWESSSKTGNKHYFFFLDGCVNPDSTRGIYNEFLTASLAEHGKVFEVLGAKTRCQPTENQLSGVGFSSTSPNRVKMIVDGRPFIVKF